MSYLADTNIITRWVVAGDPQHGIATQSIVSLLTHEEDIFITPQNLIEFRYQATRPIENNGLGMTPADANREVQRIEDFFPIAPDTPMVYEEWRELVFARELRGPRVYDARLVAVMRVHGLTHILTFDVNHFRGYEGITAVHPNDV